MIRAELGCTVHGGGSVGCAAVASVAFRHRLGVFGLVGSCDPDRMPLCSHPLIRQPSFKISAAISSTAISTVAQQNAEKALKDVLCRATRIGL